MKKDTIFILLLIFSIGFIIPIFEQSETVTVSPNVVEQIVYNAHSPQLELTVDISRPIAVNITKLSSDENLQDLVHSSTFSNSKTIDDLQPGLYIISFFSVQIATIEINGKGIYLSNIIIIAILAIVNLILYYQRYMN